MDIMAMLTKLLTKNGLIFAFVIIGVTNFIAYKFAGLSKGRIHGSAVAIFFGLILAYIGGGAKGSGVHSSVRRRWFDGWCNVP